MINMPENLQGSEAYDRASTAADALDNAHSEDDLEQVVSYLQEAIDA